MCTILHRHRLLTKKYYLVENKYMRWLVGEHYGKWDNYIHHSPNRIVYNKKAKSSIEVKWINSAGVVLCFVQVRTHAEMGLVGRNKWIHIWGLWCQKQVSQAGISNYIPQFTVRCNYLSLHEIPASGNKHLMYNADSNDLPKRIITVSNLRQLIL